MTKSKSGSNKPNLRPLTFDGFPLLGFILPDSRILGADMKRKPKAAILQTGIAFLGIIRCPICRNQIDLI